MTLAKVSKKLLHKWQSNSTGNSFMENIKFRGTQCIFVILMGVVVLIPITRGAHCYLTFFVPLPLMSHA